MTYTKTVCLTISLSFLFVTYTQAESIRVRLVEGYNSKTKTVAGELQDVSSLLKKNLPYNSFALIAQSSISTPVKSPVMIGSYQISITRQANNYAVKVFRKKRLIIQSKVKLKSGSPVIIGGFSGNRGKLMFILTK